MANKDNRNPNNFEGPRSRRSRRRKPNQPDTQTNPPAPSRSNPRWPDPSQINLGADQPPINANHKDYQPLVNNRRATPTPANQSRSRRQTRATNVPSDPYANPAQVRQSSIPLQSGRPSNPKSRPPSRGILRVFLYLLLAVVVAAGLAGLYVYTRFANFTNAISVQKVDINNNPVNGSSFNGHDSINIVLLGLDTRPGDPDGSRSDTIIVVRVNPQTKAASMLSIPRDLWVDIPNNEPNRINAAYTLGDAAHPGTGGPPLSEATIEKNFGLHIDNFAEVDFEDFEQVINAIGGVTVDVPKPLIDANFPTLDYGLQRLYIPAGIQHMDGKTAVAYARSRHADSDTGRNQRQQQVLTAIREQGLNLGILNDTNLQQSLERAIKTDLQQGEILSLIQLGMGLNKDNIHSFAIDFNLAVPTTNAAGDVLMPQWDRIHALVNQFVHSTDTAQAAQPSAAVNPTPTAAPAKIKVLNGTFVEGRAASTQNFLQGKGFNIVGIDQAGDAGNYPNTVIMVYNNRQDAATALATALGIDKANVRVGTNASPGVDVEVICGNDLKLPTT